MHQTQEHTLRDPVWTKRKLRPNLSPVTDVRGEPTSGVKTGKSRGGVFRGDINRDVLNLSRGGDLHMGIHICKNILSFT